MGSSINARISGKCRRCRAPLFGPLDKHKGLCGVHRDPTQTSKRAGPSVISNPTASQLALAEQFPLEVRVILAHLNWSDGSRALSTRAESIARQASDGRVDELNKILRGLGHRPDNPAVDIVKYEIHKVSFPSGRAFRGGLPGMGT